MRRLGRLKTKIKSSNSQENWCEAYDFFFERLKTRYLEPIEALKKSDERIGEGFAIVTLLCSFVEFLAAAREGKNYRPCKPEKCECGKNEYHGSAAVFVNFIKKQSPFRNHFPSNNKAGEFAQSFYGMFDAHCFTRLVPKEGGRFSLENAMTHHSIRMKRSFIGTDFLMLSTNI